jgi:hypothetical protein
MEALSLKKNSDNTPMNISRVLGQLGPTKRMNRPSLKDLMVS